MTPTELTEYGQELFPFEPLKDTEVVCDDCNLAYHRRLWICPNCEWDR